jgi:hypothetical protein
MAENKSLTEELEERLDIFFGEDGHEEAATPPARSKSPLEELRSILLSLEWEITDGHLDKFLAELENLKSSHKENSIEHLFIKLLDSIVRYIKVRKANAHPNTIKLLNNAFRNFATVVESTSASESEKKNFLLATINEFKEVKAAIAKDKMGRAQDQASPAPAPKPAFTIQAQSGTIEPGDAFLEMEPAAEAPPELKAERYAASPPLGLDGMTPHEAFALAMQQIKQTIEKEFQALRAELRMWRSGQ